MLKEVSEQSKPTINVCDYNFIYAFSIGWCGMPDKDGYCAYQPSLEIFSRSTTCGGLYCIFGQDTQGILAIWLTDNYYYLFNGFHLDEKGCTPVETDVLENLDKDAINKQAVYELNRHVLVPPNTYQVYIYPTNDLEQAATILKQIQTKIGLR